LADIRTKPKFGDGSKFSQSMAERERKASWHAFPSEARERGNKLAKNGRS
jgi:hypothetical protein